MDFVLLVCFDSQKQLIFVSYRLSYSGFTEQGLYIFFGKIQKFNFSLPLDPVLFQGLSQCNTSCSVLYSSRFYRK